MVPSRVVLNTPDGAKVVEGIEHPNIVVRRQWHDAERRLGRHSRHVGNPVEDLAEVVGDALYLARAATDFRPVDGADEAVVLDTRNKFLQGQLRLRRQFFAAGRHKCNAALLLTYQAGAAEDSGAPPPLNVGPVPRVDPSRVNDGVAQMYAHLAWAAMASSDPSVRERAPGFVLNARTRASRRLAAAWQNPSSSRHAAIKNNLVGLGLESPEAHFGPLVATEIVGKITSRNQLIRADGIALLKEFSGTPVGAEIVPALQHAAFKADGLQVSTRARAELKAAQLDPERFGNEVNVALRHVGREDRHKIFGKKPSRDGHNVPAAAVYEAAYDEAVLLMFWHETRQMGVSLRDLAAAQARLTDAGQTIGYSRAPRPGDGFDGAFVAQAMPATNAVRSLVASRQLGTTGRADQSVRTGVGY